MADLRSCLLLLPLLLLTSDKILLLDLCDLLFLSLVKLFELAVQLFKALDVLQGTAGEVDDPHLLGLHLLLGLLLHLVQDPSWKRRLWVVELFDNLIYIFLELALVELAEGVGVIMKSMLVSFEKAGVLLLVFGCLQLRNIDNRR